ncbi:MAG: NADH-quinone oxidoreductase subunit A [Planctomycetes bacterium]|nr:NADH-quinone oxidoreductase subunit A [Planctomycetota bacterium]
MSASEAWIAAGTFTGVAFVIAAGTLIAAALLRVRARKHSEARTRTYECGEEPDGGAWVRFHPRYYLVALVFVIFDVEAVFLLPWAVSLRSVGAVALWSMLAFLAILLLGWVYAVKKGALRWV